MHTEAQATSEFFGCRVILCHVTICSDPGYRSILLQFPYGLRARMASVAAVRGDEHWPCTMCQSALSPRSHCCVAGIKVEPSLEARSEVLTWASYL